jgi:hypothetical protein
MPDEIKFLQYQHHIQILLLPMKRTAHLLLPLLLTQLAIPSLAHAMSSEDLYRLCSEFPHNSQCKGYEAPIGLAKRPGKTAACLIKTPEAELKGACKFQIDDQEITLYQEFGDNLSVLQNEKATRKIIIPNSDVSSIQYREGKKTNTGATVVNTLAFGLVGLFLTPKKKYAEVSVNYAVAGGSGDSNYAVMVLDRDTGLETRFQLEKATGKTVELPEAKKEEIKKEDSKKEDTK